MTTPLPLAVVLTQAAAAAAGGQQFPAGALYLVATPIGNLADLSLRAIHVLAIVDAVACEDTRHSGSLLRHLGLNKPLLALHQHNEQASAAGVVQRLARGERIAYLSDAGTPAISDPGALLVAAAQRAGHRCLPIPGASSAVAALSVAGDVQPGGFRFVGFLPTRASERQSALQQLAAEGCAQVLFEAPHRIEALAAQLAASCADRRVTLCRELTKQFEAVVSLSAAELPAWLAADAHRLRGEFVLVLHGRAALDTASVAVGERLLRLLLRELPLKQAVALAAEYSGGARNALYQRALAWRQGTRHPDERQGEPPPPTIAR